MNGELSTRQDRSSYFQEKVTALLEQVDEGYGAALLDQLIHRMELTVQEFVMEIDQLVEQLKHNAAAQDELLGRIRNEEMLTGTSSLSPEPGVEEEIPEWERRLANLERPAK